MKTSASVRRSRRSWRRTRAAVASVAREVTTPPGRREKPPRGRPHRCARGANRAAQPRRLAPSRIRTSSSQRFASSITWLETSSAAPLSASECEHLPEIAAEHGVETDGRLVEDEHVRLAEQCRRERHARALSAERVRTSWSACRPRSTVDRRLVDPVVGRIEHAREVAQVLARGEVAVDRRRLRHVTDLPSQRRRSCRLAEHDDVSRLDHLHADDRAHERRLPGTARAEQAGHDAVSDLERDVPHRDVAAAADTQVADFDRDRVLRYVSPFSRSSRFASSLFSSSSPIPRRISGVFVNWMSA